MENNPKTPLIGINKYIPEDAAFICFASFEDRCFTLAQYIDKNLLKAVYVFRNTEPSMDEKNIDNYNHICELIDNCQGIPVQLCDPVGVAEATFNVVLSIQKNHIRNIIIDVSTFTHEALLMLLKAIFILFSSFDSIIMVYNGASMYAPWLSMGCKEVRNVIGFPGLMNPINKNHLVVLTGFEKERATKLVELYEPDALTIGFGIDPTYKHYSETMKRTKRDLEEWFGKLDLSWSSFEFSCRDIEATIKALSDIIEKSPDDNIVLVPLNTKLSTIAVAMVALKNKRLQVAYPVPETYNFQYSEPGDSFTVIDLKRLFELMRIV